MQIRARKKTKNEKNEKKKKTIFFCLVVVLELFETGIVLNKSPIPIHTHIHILDTLYRQS